MPGRENMKDYGDNLYRKTLNLFGCLNGLKWGAAKFIKSPDKSILVVSKPNPDEIRFMPYSSCS